MIRCTALTLRASPSPQRSFGLEAIANILATESGNLAADDAVQALGGYGYCVEYEVEKIRRDIRILRIYEGTTEILQNIVGLYRMRESVRSKGRFYNEMADRVEPFTEAGGPAVAKTARFLSKALDLLFREKLTQQQFVLMECAFLRAADLDGAIELQSGRLADLDLIAREITKS